jgi:hypothetical protein
VISSTRSNTFEDSEGWNRPGNGRSTQIAADAGSTDTIGNNKELEQNAIKENDGDYMKAHDERGKTYTEKVIKLRKFFIFTCMQTLLSMYVSCRKLHENIRKVVQLLTVMEIGR